MAQPATRLMIPARAAAGLGLRHAIVSANLDKATIMPEGGRHEQYDPTQAERQRPRPVPETEHWMPNEKLNQPRLASIEHPVSTNNGGEAGIRTLGGAINPTTA